MASARAEAARALCGAFQPPTLGLCVAPLDDGSDVPSHVHLREALSKAVAQLEDTGSVVHAFKVTDTGSAMESRFPFGHPTCSRLLVDNPSNSIQ